MIEYRKLETKDLDEFIRLRIGQLRGIMAAERFRSRLLTWEFCFIRISVS